MIVKRLMVVQTFQNYYKTWSKDYKCDKFFRILPLLVLIETQYLCVNNNLSSEFLWFFTES